MKQIEIEFRSIFSKQKFGELKKYLDLNAESLGQDDKDVHFFILEDKLLKVTDNISKNTAKLTLKLSKIGLSSSFEEIEFQINRSDVIKAIQLFRSLKLTDNIMSAFQQRHNYLYKEVELALKHSKEWGYHLELEIIITDESEKDVAEIKIREVAKELGVDIMSDEELKNFVESIEKKK